MTISFVLLSVLVLAFISLTIGVGIKIFISETSNFYITFSPILVILLILILPIVSAWLLIFRISILEKPLQEAFKEDGREFPKIHFNLINRIKLSIGLSGAIIKWFPEFINLFTEISLKHSLGKTKIKTKNTEYVVSRLIQVLTKDHIVDIRSRMV